MAQFGPYADVVSSIFSMVLASDQVLFMMYHYNSYANNPVMLRSTKPMVMRDIFLTRSNSHFPNPLSCVYVNKELDCLVNCFTAFTLAKPVCVHLGWKHCVALYFGAGFFSSFAYLFGCYANKNKTTSTFDCACTSNGAYAAFATLSLFMPKTYIPFSKRTPISYIGIPYLLKCAYDEYIGPKFVEKRRVGDIEVRNWGFVGGVFFTLIYSSLFFRTRADLTLAKVFHANLKPALRKQV